MSGFPSETPPVGGAAAATTGETVLRGGLWSIAARLIPQAYLFVVSVAAARFLGPELFGRQSFIAFVELSVVMLLAGGLSAAFVRSVGASFGRDQPQAARRLIRWAWTVEGAAALVGGGALLAVAAGGAEPSSAWVLAAIACGLGVLHSVPSSLLIGVQRWRAASIVGLVTGAFSTVATIAVLAAGGGITGMFAVEAVTAAVNLAWTGALARRAADVVAPRGGPLPAEAWRAVRAETWRYALPASYGVLLTIVVWRRSEFFLLERYSTETQIALYSVAFALLAALIQFPDAVSAALFPAIATLFGAGELERIRTGFGRALRLLLLFTLPVTAGALALGPGFVHLVYGEEFRDAGPVLLIMLAVFPLVPLLQLSKSLLAGLGQLRYQLLAETGAAALAITLAVLLVPDHGAVGAAIANVAAQIVAAVLIFAYALRRIGPVPWNPGTLWRAALASAAAGLAAWAGVSLVESTAGGVLLGLAVGTGVFAALAVAGRILPSDDADWLDGIAGARLGGLVGWVCRHCA
ncbi:MAG: lipopolysaccharide biosynthesis protein [Gaiellaceae bacterium]